jgi:hypothetical protein
LLPAELMSSTIIKLDGLKSSLNQLQASDVEEAEPIIGPTLFCGNHSVDRHQLIAALPAREDLDILLARFLDDREPAVPSIRACPLLPSREACSIPCCCL